MYRPSGKRVPFDQGNVLSLGNTAGDIYATYQSVSSERRRSSHPPGQAKRRTGMPRSSGNPFQKPYSYVWALEYGSEAVWVSHIARLEPWGCSDQTPTRCLICYPLLLRNIMKACNRLKRLQAYFFVSESRNTDVTFFRCISLNFVNYCSFT